MALTVVRGESLAPATVVINDVSPVPDRSSLEVDRSHYVAGEEMTLTVTLKDAQNHPVTGQAAALTEEAVTAPGATLKAGSNWADNGDGSYTTTYTAMTTSSGNRATLTLAGWSTGSQSGEYAITADSPASVNSAIGLDSTTYIAGSDMTVTVTLKDAQDNPVSGQAAALTAGAVTLPNATLKAGSNWADNGDGSYTATYTAMTTSSGNRATLLLASWSSSIHSDQYSIESKSINITGSQRLNFYPRNISILFTPAPGYTFDANCFNVKGVAGINTNRITISTWGNTAMIQNGAGFYDYNLTISNQCGYNVVGAVSIQFSRPGASAPTITESINLAPY